MSKRIFAVLTAALLCVSLMAIPAFAAEGQTFSSTTTNPGGHFYGSSSFALDVSAPYALDITFTQNGTVYTVSGVSVSFGNKTEFSNYVQYDAVYDYFDFADGTGAPAMTSKILISYKDYGDHYSFSIRLYVETVEGTVTHYGDALSVTFTPVTPEQGQPSTGSGISLSDVVDGDMVGNVLDSVVSLLPVVLAAIVGYIALRKGINFLRDVLHGA